VDVKIDNSVKKVATPRAKDTGSGKTRGPAERSLAASVVDQVQLTDNAGRMRALEAQLADVGVSDANKVEAVRQAIADGSFQVDEEVVADGLVQESLEQISRQVKP
jgi:negative regulator of flagellin synthesis FlgM